MNWDVPYTVSRSLVLQIGPGGELLAGNSVSRMPQALAQDGLAVLLAFAGGRTPSEALARLQADWEIEEAGFSSVVDALVSQNSLTPVAGDDAALAGGGFASPAEHFVMMQDTVRVSAYRRAIFRHCRDKVVVEIGCGSGILSIFAAKAGARRVIAIEESRIADLAAAMFEANGVADRVELRRANSRDVSVDERADVIIHEVLGVDPFGENILRFIEDARERLLAPDGRLIPSAMDVYCVGFEVADRPYLDRARACAQLSELEGLHGIDFSAFRQFVSETQPDPFPRPLGDLGLTQFTPRILTAETHLYRVDFASGSSETIEPRNDLRLRVLHPGTLGGVVVYFRAHLDDDTFLSTSPYALRTSWGWNARALSKIVAVEPGQEIPLVSELRTTAGAQSLHIDLA
ncbi:MAG TPA: 50S ribosomal protein L11 methyltransferase [Thermoanaerobaculia bacterium]|nr:50S ribosomal protein L11 methyltransferase [Thermoanaerobaculia bacterium]